MLRTDTDPVKHMRLAALHCCRALHGPELISAWRREPYTRQAHHGRAEAVARPGRAPGGGRGKRWPTGATIWRSHDLLTRAGHAVFGAVLALNGVYAPHRTIKWQSHLIGELNVAPKHFAERLGLLGTSSSARALRQAETLLPDTVQLVQARTDADIGAFCEELSQRRRTIDPPSPRLHNAPSGAASTASPGAGIGEQNGEDARSRRLLLLIMHRDRPDPAAWATDR